MENEKKQPEKAVGEMHKRRETMADGSRYFIEFYPPMRTATKLKFVAGSEAGAGTFIKDTLPEEKAAELRNLIEPCIR